MESLQNKHITSSSSPEIPITWNLSQILEEVEKTTHSISIIDQELDDLFSERVLLEERVQNLSSLGKDLNSVQSRSKEMTLQIRQASISGNEISKQVSELDLAQTRVEKVLNRVTLMLDLKETIKNVEEYINDCKYDEAANETHRILHCRNESELKEIDEVSFEILQDLEHRLTTLICQQCENALYENNLAEVIRYAALYRLLGDEMKKKGLNIYCTTVNKEVRLSLEEQNFTLSSQVSGSIINYVGIIEGYIDMIFQSITDNEQQLKVLFCGGTLQPILTLVEILHNETDLELSKLLNHYLQSHRMDDLVNEINAFNRKQHLHTNANVSSADDFGVERAQFERIKKVTDIGKLDKILDEISHLSQELMAYDTTMRELINDQQQQQQQEVMHGFELPKNSKICALRTRLTGDYILFEQFNMNYQILRVLMEENDIDSSNGTESGGAVYRSRLSGAVYYLLKTLALRAFNTYDCNVSCAIINNICNCLESTYREWLDKKLKLCKGQSEKTNIAEQFFKSTKNLYSGGMGMGMGMANYVPLNDRKSIILLNTIDESISDTKLITNQLEQEVNEVFDQVSEKEKFKIRQTLNGFEDISKSFERIIERGIFKYSSTFHPILASSLRRFKESNYQITDKQFEKKGVAKNNNLNGQLQASKANNGNNLSFVTVLIEASKATFYALSKRLTAKNFDRILICILSYYLREIERFVLMQKFTFWGGMKFDQNRQELQSYFTELTKTHSIRSEFKRIRCVAEILQFSKVEEAAHYLNDEMTANQTLNAKEIKKYLALRTEFNQYDIQQLKL